MVDIQDTSGAQDGAASNPVYVIGKLIPKTGQGVPRHKSCYHVGNRSGQKPQEIGQCHVVENHVCQPLTVAKSGDMLWQKRVKLAGAPIPTCRRKMVFRATSPMVLRVLF